LVTGNYQLPLTALLAAIILTLNEAKHLPDCLRSLAWADEVVVFDSFSTDRTPEIAREHGARLLQHRFENYAWQRNAALDQVQAEWILFVDADERATPELAEEVEAACQNGDMAGWWIPRHNYIFGRLTLHAGWYPDYQMRLLRHGRARFDPERHVHELAQLNGPEGRLSAPLIHINYESLPEFLERQRRYAAYDAGILRRSGFRPGLRHYLTRPLRHFYYRYIGLGGYRDGFHGLRLSALMAYFEFVKLKFTQRQTNPFQTEI
jgi:glycosyltransferase involved in cell wall biosynthesis